MPAPFRFHNIFRYQNFFEAQKGSSTKYIGTVKQKISTDDPDKSPHPYP